MTAIRVSARDRRMLVGGAIACLTLALGARGVPALVRWRRDARANAAELRDEATRACASVAHAGATRDSLARRTADYRSLTPHWLEGETTAGGGGSLASLVSAAATASNVRLGSVQIHADTGTASALTRVRVRADVTGDIGGIAALLGALETSPTMLLVRELSIAQPEPAAGDDRAEVLRAELVVDGLMVTPNAEGHR